MTRTVTLPSASNFAAFLSYGIETRSTTVSTVNGTQSITCPTRPRPRASPAPAAASTSGLANLGAFTGRTVSLGLEYVTDAASRPRAR